MIPFAEQILLILQANVERFTGVGWAHASAAAVGDNAGVHRDDVPCHLMSGTSPSVSERGQDLRHGEEGGQAGTHLSEEIRSLPFFGLRSDRLAINEGAGP